MTASSNNKNSGRTYAGLTSEQRKQDRYNQFLKAALETFGTTGFRTATVRGLCKQAKLTDRYFYESFASLEELLMAIYERCMKDLKIHILTAIKTEYAKTNAEKAIVAGLDAYFNVLENNQIARICMIELEGVSDEVNRLYYGYINDFSKTMVSLANHAYPNWNIDPQQKLVLAISLVGAMRQTATNCLISNQSFNRKTLVDSTSTLFLGVLQMIGENA